VTTRRSQRRKEGADHDEMWRQVEAIVQQHGVECPESWGRGTDDNQDYILLHEVGPDSFAYGPFGIDKALALVESRDQEEKEMWRILPLRLGIIDDLNKEGE
jgi:hypothetical protein